VEAEKEFTQRFSFALDAFQSEGVRALAEGRSVLVAAPTGAGKTIVGEYAVWRALTHGRKCFYTTPIKALSNQKFRELGDAYGRERVGLLTGDRVVNGDAPIVVMTTEVLRNMLYEQSSTLDGLQSVVLDEVHYLADRERGAVWEEVIIQLAADVQLACLSATVSNAEEFGAWLASVRDQGEGIDIVISDERPVPLSHHYAFDQRIEPMFRAGGKRGGKKPDAAKIEAARQARGGVPNPDIVMLERRSVGSGRRTRRGRQVPGGPRLRAPRRSQLVLELGRRKWLPAIVFVFSRSGCDAAVDQLVGDGLRLTSPSERTQIRKIVDEQTADLPADDLHVLGFHAWRDALAQGIAAHHAGMVPAFKETVEELFVRGLLKVCFATETLALGINMPARTVVVERLEKWDGRRHTLLTPGQFTQLTGRAGRRGLDERGYAVVLHQRDVDFPTVASLVGRRVEPLTSRFQPSYNMAVNILRQHGRRQAEALLARSFAQWQADARVSGDLERIRRNREALVGYRENLRSDHGDFPAYWSLRRQLSRLERATKKNRREAQQEAVRQALEGLRPGDVARLEADDLVAVTAVRETRGGVPIAEAITSDGRMVRVGPRELSAPPEWVTTVALPAKGGPRQAAYRKVVANALHQVDPPLPRPRPAPDGEDKERTARIARLRAEVQAHPVHRDPELHEIEVWAHRHDQLAEDTDKLERQVERRTGSLVGRFDRILGILTDLGYLREDDDDEPRPTARGIQLAGLYAETDLLLTEALRRNLLHGLDDAELVAVLSCFTFETRSKEPPEPEMPTPAVAKKIATVSELWDRLATMEEGAGLPTTRPPDAGFAAAVWRWAGGAELDDALASDDMTAGDFVRNVKQVADLLRQLRDVLDDRELAGRAHRANKVLVRGVVAHSSV
jgi:ATP-dependent RNA helicase HelY